MSETFVVRESAAQSRGKWNSVRRRYGLLRLTPRGRASFVAEHPNRRDWNGLGWAAENTVITPGHNVAEVIKTWENCNVGSSSRCAAAIAEREAQVLRKALNRLYSRGSKPELKRVVSYFREYGEVLPAAEKARLRKSRRALLFNGTIDEVIAWHGYSGLAAALEKGNPAAIKLYRKLGGKRLALIDQAMHRGY